MNLKSVSNSNLINELKSKVLEERKLLNEILELLHAFLLFSTLSFADIKSSSSWPDQDRACKNALGQCDFWINLAHQECDRYNGIFLNSSCRKTEERPDGRNFICVYEAATDCRGK